MLTRSSESIEHDLIALIAYFSWEARGRHEGSADDDWLQAERAVRALDDQQMNSPPTNIDSPLGLDPLTVEGLTPVLDSFYYHIAVDYYSCLL